MDDLRLQSHFDYFYKLKLNATKLPLLIRVNASSETLKERGFITKQYDQQSQRFLKRTIQQNKHSSLEDAKTAFDLFLFSVNHGYIKPTWIKMDHNIESFVPDLEFILKACQTHQTNIAAVYLRGSRAIETNNEKSDYDYIVVQYNLKQLSGSLIRYGNVDMEVHDVSNFKSYKIILYGF